MLPEIFQEQLLNAPDVCNNCFGLLKEPRPSVPAESRRTDRTYPSGQFARNLETTTVEFVPDEQPTRSQAVFCECGCSSAYDRYRSEIIPRQEFRLLLKTAIQTVEAKGITLSRRHAVHRALQLGLPTESSFPVYSADRAIADGIAHGIEMVTVHSTARTPQSAVE